MACSKQWEKQRRSKEQRAQCIISQHPASALPLAPRQASSALTHQEKLASSGILFASIPTQKNSRAPPPPPLVKSCHWLLQEEGPPQWRRQSPALVRCAAADEDGADGGLRARDGASTLVVPNPSIPTSQQSRDSSPHPGSQRAPLEHPSGLGLLSKWHPPPPFACVLSLLLPSLPPIRPAGIFLTLHLVSFTPPSHSRIPPPSGVAPI